MIRYRMIEELNLKDAVKYHYDKFPPENLDYHKLMKQLVKSTEAIARFDQMCIYRSIRTAMPEFNRTLLQ